MAYVLKNSKSPFTKIRSVPVDSVKLTDDFWSPRLADLRQVTLPLQHKKLEETGHFFDFRRAAGLEAGQFKGLIFYDSDAYKWLEATSFTLASSKDDDLLRHALNFADLIKKAQDKDGYLDTYFALDKKSDRWKNLRDNHELYCAGHMIQAALAFRRATGNGELLEAAERLADHVIDTFGPGKKEGVPGHPEIEMALVELYRETGKRKYLDEASYFLNARGKGLIGGSPYYLDHAPFRELKHLTGHAVRALYLASGAADLYAETGDPPLLKALSVLWEDLQKKTYVTGGVGSRHEGETLGDDYELPNARAYAETCAAVANAMFNYRMLLITGEAKYADAMELAVYNGALSGISIDGTRYFYANPLADRGSTRRQEWYECACCPTNIVRLLAYVPSLFYGVSQEGIWVNLYGRSEASIELNGSKVVLRQETEYPWRGKVRIEVKLVSDLKFSLNLRVPEWASSAEIKWPEGKEKAKPGSYFSLNRTWHDGDAVDIEIPLQVSLIVANHRVFEDTCRVTLKRGPLVYCVESEDNDFDVWDLELANKDFKIKDDFILNKKIVSILGKGILLRSKEEWTYAEEEKANALIARQGVDFKAIPYYAWANRRAGPMTVWILAPETADPSKSGQEISHAKQRIKQNI